MIDHSDCDHERSSSARARCRRARAKGELSTGPLQGPTCESCSHDSCVRLRPKNGRKKVTWGGKAHHDPDRERNTGQVPGRKDLECHVCHVERIVARGTDPLTGILLYVGERCSYMVERQDDFEVVEA